jgi:hypothetical protein
MVLAIILFMGKVSGAHLNPAVSFAFALRGDFPWRRVPGYIVIQLVGGLNPEKVMPKKGDRLSPGVELKWYGTNSGIDDVKRRPNGAARQTTASRRARSTRERAIYEGGNGNETALDDARQIARTCGQTAQDAQAEAMASTAGDPGASRARARCPPRGARAAK